MITVTSRRLRPRWTREKRRCSRRCSRKVNPDAAAVVDDVGDVPDIEIEADGEALGEAEGEVAVVEEAPPVLKAAPKPKAKAKGKK